MRLASTVAGLNMVSANFRFWRSRVMVVVASSNNTACERLWCGGPAMNLIKNKTSHDYPIPFMIQISKCTPPSPFFIFPIVGKKKYIKRLEKQWCVGVGQVRFWLCKEASREAKNRKSQCLSKRLQTRSYVNDDLWMKSKRKSFDSLRNP